VVMETVAKICPLNVFLINWFNVIWHKTQP